jgi:hypothetical protein
MVYELYRLCCLSVIKNFDFYLLQKKNVGRTSHILVLKYTLDLYFL